MGHPGRIVVAQLILGTLCALAFFALFPGDNLLPGEALGETLSRGHSALSALGCCVIPRAYYAWSQQRTMVATRLLLQGVLRMLLTVTLMAVSIVVGNVEPVGFFVTFAVVQLGYLTR